MIYIANQNGLLIIIKIYIIIEEDIGYVSTRQQFIEKKTTLRAYDID